MRGLALSSVTRRRVTAQAAHAVLVNRDGDLLLQREDASACRRDVAALEAPVERGTSRIIRTELRSGSYDVYCPIPRHGEKERTTLRVQ